MVKIQFPQCPDSQNPSLEAAIINSIFYFFPEMFCEGTTAKSISFASSAKHFISDNWTFKSIQLYIKNERHVTVVMNICFHFCQIVIHLKKNAPEWQQCYLGWVIRSGMGVGQNGSSRLSSVASVLCELNKSI